MSEERTKVLEMLATGKITIEQANQLIAVLGEEPLSEGTQGSNRSKDTRELVQEFGGPPLEAQEPARFTLDQIIRLSEREINADYIKALRDAGLTYLTTEQIIELHDHDVDISYLARMRRAGVTGLSIDQIEAVS
ncbi:MAG: hypothetical protein M3Z08_15450 [Chloroflexota bacterium]|nr:hypothetical protein [Chloroflexota bacterium]